MSQFANVDFVEARHHQIRPGRPQLSSITKTGDTEGRHAACARRLDASGCVLDHKAVFGCYP